jgi:membrane fusion protein, multidrug efflux system
MTMNMRTLALLVLQLILAGSALAGQLPLFEGVIEPKELVKYSSHVPGILAEVKVERGDRVVKGQTLAHLKSALEESSVRLAQARVDYGKRKALRNEELYRKKLVSVHDKDELETEIQMAELELALAREQLALRTIASTVDGVVVSRKGSPGEYVSAEPFLIVARINPLHVEIVVPFEYFGAIKVGKTGTVLLGPPVMGRYPAKVVVVDQVMDAASRTFGVRLELPNSQLKLPAGMRCQVEF